MFCLGSETRAPPKSELCPTVHCHLSKALSVVIVVSAEACVGYVGGEGNAGKPMSHSALRSKRCWGMSSVSSYVSRNNGRMDFGKQLKVSTKFMTFSNWKWNDQMHPRYNLNHHCTFFGTYPTSHYKYRIPWLNIFIVTHTVECCVVIKIIYNDLYL